MLADLVAGAVAGLAVALPIGAIGSYLVGLAARERPATAVSAALGVATVDGGYAVLAALGGAGLQVLLHRVAEPLTVVSALVLVAVAVRTGQQALRRFRSVGDAAAEPSPTTPGRAYLRLVALTAVNPATVITFTAVVLGRTAVAGGASMAGVALFAMGAFVASAAWQLVLVGGGSLLGRLLHGRVGQLVIAAASVLLMLGLAVALLSG